MSDDQLSDEKKQAVRLDIENIASVVAAYYASLVGNGIPDSIALELTKAMQSSWFSQILKNNQ